MPDPFRHILSVEAPDHLSSKEGSAASPEFVVSMHTDGEVPFAQVVIWQSGEQRAVCPSVRVTSGQNAYQATVPSGVLRPGEVTLQVEGCRQGDLARASGEDWVKAFVTLTFSLAASGVTPQSVILPDRSSPDGVRIYFGIHKHMHQPYYRTADPGFWDGGTDEVFATRRGAYSDYLADAIDRYLGGGLPHAGISTSYSGSLIEQLERCQREGLAGGGFTGWSGRLRKAASQQTALGNPRLDFVSFGFFHPLMPLIPERDIVRQVAWHRQIVRDVLGAEVSPVMFPPETAFHVRMIPALVKAGVKAVVYDSIHRFRACQDYPYAGPPEGMLPPNRAEQENPPVTDWLQLNNVWAGSLISPSLLRPSRIRYLDPEGVSHHIIGIPAERYLGNEDARGGYGALQYESVLGQLYDKVISSGSFDPKHPPFFLLHSDGDNYGGGTDSYYRHNTDGLVQWLKNETRFELTTVLDYLARFPVADDAFEHVEPGAWSGADNGDPQFMKWFSLWDAEYSPDLNSWAVLTALSNLVHASEDALVESPERKQAERLLLMAETSCYWYWTGQPVWDGLVTDAANLAASLLGPQRELLQAEDRTGPTIFPPWSSPTNPGGMAWGQGRLVDAPRQAELHTLIADVTGVRSADVVLRSDEGEVRIPLFDRGEYPSRTGAALRAHHFTTLLPVGRGNVRYFVEAVDQRGNLSRSSLERVFLP